MNFFGKAPKINKSSIKNCKLWIFRESTKNKQIHQKLKSNGSRKRRRSRSFEKFLFVVVKKLAKTEKTYWSIFIYVSGLGNVPRRNNYAFDCLVWTWHENTLWKSSTPWLALEENYSAIAASSAFVWPRISLALYEKKRTITHQRKDKKTISE